MQLATLDCSLEDNNSQLSLIERDEMFRSQGDAEGAVVFTVDETLPMRIADLIHLVGNVMADVVQ